MFSRGQAGFKSQREEEYEDHYSYSYPRNHSNSYVEEDEEIIDSPSSSSCSQGHRSSLKLNTSQGGSICLICFCNLISNPNSPSVHVSYALSQLSLAISDTDFLHNLRTFHVHLLVSPLVHLLSNSDDEPIARQTIDLISCLCDSDDQSVFHEIFLRISNQISSGSLGWSRRQIYTLHCFGVLLKRQMDGLPVHVKDIGALITNLVIGLQLPSEEIRGEIFFVLYKLFIIQATSGGNNGYDLDELLVFCPKLLYLSLEALMKTQSDEVRMNCLALLTVLAQKGCFESSFATDDANRSSGEADNFMQSADYATNCTPMISLFAEAIKSPLLSSDIQVQIGTLDLILYCLSTEGGSAKHAELLVEENIADYVFEILRLSGQRDPVINSSVRVLSLLSVAEQAFSQRLVIGFSALVPVLRYLSEIPFHPAQCHTLKLISGCLSNCPGIVSSSHLEELTQLLTVMFQRHTDGDMGMLPETFILACSIIVEVLKSPSAQGILTLPASTKEVTRSVILCSFSNHQKHPNDLYLYALYLLKEAHTYSYEVNKTSNNMELGNCIIELCEAQLLPWLRREIDDTEEEIILGVLETFQSILLQGPDPKTRKFAENVASSSWFSLSYGCLGSFPTEKMKWRVYLLLSSVIDGVLGHDSGQPIRDAAQHLPSDPLDLLFLLGQRSCHDLKLITCQSAVLLILHTSSLYDERLADEKQVLASLDQYILVNSSNFQSELVSSTTLMQLVNLYALYRGSAKIGYQIPYSPEAEKLLFHLIVEKEFDMLSTRIHPVALKWLFQQEKISKPLSHQILSFCRSNCPNGMDMIANGNRASNIDTTVIGELVAAGDTFGAKLLVFLLKHVQEEEGQEENITSVVNFMITIINIFPDASDQLCLQGIVNVIHSLYSNYSSSPKIFISCSLLTFNILRLVQPETISDHNGWFLVIAKLLEVSIPSIVAGNQEGLLILGILSLVLNHSTNQVFEEASKAILLNNSLATTNRNIVQSACSKGPALIDHDENTRSGETLIFVLLLLFFSLRSLHVLLPGSLEWQHFVEPSSEEQPLTKICIHCRDLCRLIHFGSPVLKLISSYCLLELITRISEQTSKNREEMNCSVKYLQSVTAVLEGLVFDNDVRVAINSAICLSKILGWEKPRVIKDSKWCRLVVEELALSLAAPSLASKSFTNQHKAPTHIAIALLRLDQEPEWMRSIFDSSCICGIVKNLSASNVSAEMVQLFRELIISGYMKSEQIAVLNRVFQACRKHVYTECSKEVNRQEHFEKVVAMPHDLDKVLKLLILQLSPSKLTDGVQTTNNRLLEELEIFFQESSKRE